MISSLPFYLLPGIRDHGSISLPEKVKPIQVYTYKHPDVNLHSRCYFSTSGIYNNADQTGINLAKSVSLGKGRNNIFSAMDVVPSK